MTKIALISDIHSNYNALKMVLNKIDELNVDSLICLGDIVNYGPNPVECIDLLKERNVQVIQGNHDAAVSGDISIKNFPKLMQKSLKWTIKNLSDKHLEYLRNLPLTLNVPWGVVAHGSPHDSLWHYVKDSAAALIIFRFSKDRFYFVGHTHAPVGYSYNEKQQVKMISVRAASDGVASLQFEQNCRYILNPGSVGQPRDNDRRASFAVLNVEDGQPCSIKWYRIDYDAESVREQVSKNRLPRLFGDRLLIGR